MGKAKAMKRPLKLYWFYIRVLGGFAWRRFTPTVKGLENIPKAGPLILAANHLAVIDDAVIPLTFPRMVHYMAKEEYFTGKGIRGAFKKFFFTSAGTFPVNRSGGGKSADALLHAKEILERGEVFGIHPEGTRSPDGKLYRGHTGAARLALQTGVSILPVGLIGTNDAQPIGQVMPKKVHVEIRYGKPIEVEKVENPTHEQVRELTDLMMKKIAELTDQEYVNEYAQVVKKRMKEEREAQLAAAAASESSPEAAPKGILRPPRRPLHRLAAETGSELTPKSE